MTRLVGKAMAKTLMVLAPIIKNQAKETPLNLSGAVLGGIAMTVLILLTKNILLLLRIVMLWEMVTVITERETLLEVTAMVLKWEKVH